MTNLELNKFGVQELNKEEMINVEGGFLPFIINGVALVIEVIAAAAIGDLVLDFNHYVEVGKEGAAAGRAAARR